MARAIISGVRLHGKHRLGLARGPIGPAGMVLVYIM